MGDAGERHLVGNGRFSPLELLGEGAVGLVYRARDEETGQEVALKTLRLRAPEGIYQLKEEFRSLAGLVHPNLVELYELIVRGDECFFTMELLNGVGFVEHVRRRPPLLTQLRAAGAQVVRGVEALHAAGKLHRDIKPNNVMVTAGGRVVLLDFGLALSREAEPEIGSELGAGSRAYAAPEQMADGRATPASDWYSVGVMFYEALTGELPFTGTWDEVLAQKRAAPSSPRLDAEAPPELASLIRALLDPDPSRRPGAAAIATVLGEARAVLAPAATTSAAPFVGRRSELEQLLGCVRRRTDAGTLVRVAGPSGIGKSTLMRHFISTAKAELDLLVLSGRCHLFEFVPYKAFDGLVDGLSRHLLSLPAYRVEALAPRHADVLLQLFPVLRRVPALRDGRRRDHGPIEPRALRERGFTALRELLTALASRRPLLLWIDDLQWADADSLLLLRQLLETPLKLVCTYRSEDTQSPSLRALDAIAAELPASRVERIALGPLPVDESRELVRRLLDPARVDVERCSTTLSEMAAGSPFVLDTLARCLTESPTNDPTALSMDLLTQAPLAQLDDDERALLELVAISGRPLRQTLLLTAAGVGAAGRSRLARLNHRSLLRTTEIDDEPALEAYHDRIREAVISQLPPPTQQRRHLQVATALRATPSPDPEALVTHYLAAGERAEAATFAEPAAERADAALAFDRAAQLYKVAYELEATPTSRERLARRRAESLFNGGRSADAAAAFLVAADLIRGRSADEDVATLERRAAELYLRTGHVEEGMRLERAVLARHGVALVDSRGRAAATALYHRARLLLRGLSFVVRPADEVPAKTLARLDAMWGASLSLSMINHSIADAIGVQHLICALDSGQASRIARSLGYEATYESLVAGRHLRRRIDRLLETTRRLAQETGDPYDRAWAVQSEGVTAFFFARWADALRACDAANALFQECRGTAWEMACAEAFSLSALAQLGNMKELTRRLPETLRLAEARGEPFANTCRLGQPNLAWLAEDRAEHALAEANQSIASWPATRYHSQHYNYLVAATQADLYRGDAESAWQRVERDWPRLKQARLLNAQCIGDELAHLRARAALALAARSDGRERARLVAAAERAVRGVRARGLPWGAPIASIVEAACAALRDQPERALVELGRAADGFAAADMVLYGEAARWQAARLEGGDGGAARASAAALAMREAGVARPARMAAMLAPGFSPCEAD